MENEQTGLQTQQNQNLTRPLDRSLILREQPNKVTTLKDLTKRLDRLAVLYQIPNWSVRNAVLLGKWIMEKYQFETLDVITECLESPPPTGEKNWRLTPDTIESWFALKLEEQVKRREKDYEKEKLRLRELENQIPTNIPNFSELFKGTWFEKAEREECEKDYREFRDGYIKSRQDGTTEE